MAIININITINNEIFHSINIPVLIEKINDTTQDFLRSFALDAEIKTGIESTPGLLTMHVNNLQCFYPAYLPQQVFHIITYSHQEKLWGNDLLLENLSKITPVNKLTFFNTLIHEIIKCQPQVLITKEIIKPVFNQLASIQKSNTAEEKLVSLIQKLISNFIPIKSIETLKEQFANTNIDNLSPDEIFEELFDKWNNRFIELHIQEDYFKHITTASLQKDKIPSSIASKDEDLFVILKDRLFYENGIAYPAIKIIFTNRIAIDYFYITINNWASLPVKGLAPDEILVMHQPKNTGKLIYNIYNNANYWLLYKALFSDSDISANTWPSFDYLVMMLSFPLRIKAAWFIDNSSTNSILSSLEKEYPQLVGDARNFNKIPTITQVLRLLANEQISIRSMVNILQQIQNIDFIDADESQDIIFDSRVCVSELNEAAVINDSKLIYIYVRHHLKNYITAQCTHNTNNLSALLFDPSLETFLLTHTITDLEKEKILNSLRKENLSPASELSILTTSDVRLVIADLIKEEFPFLRVVAYRELTEFTNITVISRINNE